MTAPIPTAIVGVTGYEGAVLAQLLASHPRFRLVEATSRSEAGKPLSDALPNLTATSIATLPLTESVREAELVFVAVPHGAAAAIVAQCRRDGRRVVDLSADFRLGTAQRYADWYHHEHAAPELLDEAVYGLCEWRRDALGQASLVANPGCYPTTAVLSLGPAFAADLITPDIIIDAKSGISGAGRSPSRRVHFVEIYDSITAYNITSKHRHVAEMEQELVAVSPDDTFPEITFIPHLVSMNRGILATCYATLRPGVTAAQVQAAYRERYAGEPFVHVIERPPETSWVLGSNSCLIYLFADEARGRLIVIGAIDNLMKGGAGQAIQNANIMYGLHENAGLARAGVWP